MSKWRTLRRGLVIVLAGGFVLCLALLVYGRARLRHAEARFLKTFGTLDLASFERTDPPRSENAAEWLQAGAQAVFLDEKTKALVRTAASRAASEWREAERESLRRALEENGCALDLMHRAASAPKTSYRIRYTRGMAAEIPSSQALRTASALLAVELQMAVERGDAAAAGASVKALARLVTSLEDDPPLITLLTGIAAEASLLQALADVSVRASGAAHQAELLRLAREELPANDLGLCLGRAFAVEGLTLSEAFAGRFGRYEDWGPSDARLLAFALAPFSDLVRASLLDQFVARSSVLDSGVSDNERSAHTSYLPHVRLAAIGVPSFSRIRDTVRETLARRRLVRTALALRALAAAGAYPATLPPHLQHPDPLTGRPLTYRLNPDGSAVVALPMDAGGATRTSRALRSITLPAPQRHAASR